MPKRNDAVNAIPSTRIAGSASEGRGKPSLALRACVVSPPEEPLPIPRPVPTEGVELPFGYLENNDTALAVTLPRPVQAGESVTVDVEFVMRLPQKQGRWGQ